MGARAHARTRTSLELFEGWEEADAAREKSHVDPGDLNPKPSPWEMPFLLPGATCIQLAIVSIATLVHFS